MSNLRPSAPDPDGHVVVAETDAACQVVATFVDGSDPVDLTAKLADLVLLGMHLNVRRTAGIDGAPSAAEQMVVGGIDVTGPPPVFLYAHPATGTAMRAGWSDAASLITAAVAHLITAGVAADVAADEVPDDAAAVSDAAPPEPGEPGSAAG